MFWYLYLEKDSDDLPNLSKKIFFFPFTFDLIWEKLHDQDLLQKLTTGRVKHLYKKSWFLKIANSLAKPVINLKVYVALTTIRRAINLSLRYIVPTNWVNLLSFLHYEIANMNSHNIVYISIWIYNSKMKSYSAVLFLLTLFQ